MPARRTISRIPPLAPLRGLMADNDIAAGAESTLSVSDLTNAIRDVLEPAFTNVTVEGELSNFIDHRSGHRYWTLKDSGSQISCVFWKSRSLSFQFAME